MSANFKKDCPKTGKQTKTPSVDKRGDLDSAAIHMVCNDTSEDVPELGTIMTSTVLGPLSRLGSLSSESLNAAVVIESSLGDWTPVNKVKNDRVSPSKKTNIEDIVMNSTSDLVVQSTPKMLNRTAKTTRI